jgi:uncharacterized membrane protein YjfL (UPF0719 family)
MDDFFAEIGSALAYGGVGIVLLALGILVIDLLTPGNLGRLITVEGNRSAAVIASAGLIPVGGIVTTAIASADGAAGTGGPSDPGGTPSEGAAGLHARPT